MILILFQISLVSFSCSFSLCLSFLIMWVQIQVSWAVMLSSSIIDSQFLTEHSESVTLLLSITTQKTSMHNIRSMETSDVTWVHFNFLIWMFLPLSCYIVSYWEAKQLYPWWRTGRKSGCKVHRMILLCDFSGYIRLECVKIMSEHLWSCRGGDLSTVALVFSKLWQK